MSRIIEVEGISKKFSKNPERRKASYARRLVDELLCTPKVGTLDGDEFWALDDISFKLSEGESLGLVGRNGSGKSTLLKLLHGTIIPDKGRIVVSGQVQALINLGAGFNKSISGYENIKNSVVFAGVPKNIRKKVIADIIDFSELEEFIDSPVSGYSSGMYARLGFSVATNVSADLVLIDEILAVGDVNFQNKCLSKMQHLRSNGVAMILVSHSEAQVSQFCDKALWLEKGKMINIGESKQILKDYNKYMDNKLILKDELISKEESKISLNDKMKERSKDSIYGAIHPKNDLISEFKCNVKGRASNVVGVNEAFSIDYSLRLKREVFGFNISINIYTESGLLISTISTLNGDLLSKKNIGLVSATIRIADFNISPGKYVLVMPVHEGHSYLFRDVVAEFRVIAGDKLNWGLVSFDYKYKVK